MTSPCFSPAPMPCSLDAFVTVTGVPFTDSFKALFNARKSLVFASIDFMVPPCLAGGASVADLSFRAGSLRGPIEAGKLLDRFAAFHWISETIEHQDLQILEGLSALA